MYLSTQIFGWLNECGLKIEAEAMIAASHDEVCTKYHQTQMLGINQDSNAASVRKPMKPCPIYLICAQNWLPTSTWKDTTM